MSQVVIVTGGAGGIGSAICRELSGDGHRVIVADFDGEGAERLARDIGSNAVAVQVDVGSKASVLAMIDKTIGHFGRIDTLLNGAGIMPRHEVKDISEEEWDNVLRINLKGGAKDTLTSEIEMKFGEKLILSFKKEKQEKKLPTKTLEEHKLSVEEMGRKILSQNLKKSGLDPKTFENVFELLVEGKTEDVMNTLLKSPAKKQKKTSQPLKKKSRQVKPFSRK